jgi:hypothetical protein
VKIDDVTLTGMEETARKAGERAPGRWKLWGMEVMADAAGTSNVETAIPVAATSCTDENGRARTFIASHIATFDPTAALALCAAVRERDATIAATRETLIKAYALMRATGLSDDFEQALNDGIARLGAAVPS